MCNMRTLQCLKYKKIAKIVKIVEQNFYHNFRLFM